MTVEEKRKKVEEYCVIQDGCNTCKLKSGNGWCYEHSIDMCAEEALDEALDIIGIKAESSNIDHPNHYQGKNECIDVMLAMFGVEAVKGFCKCNAYKYRFRAGQKEGNSAEQDIAKAEWYESYLIGLEGGQNG